MISLPDEIIGIVYCDDNGDLALPDTATDEQRRILVEFLEDVRSGKLSDVEIIYNA